MNIILIIILFLLMIYVCGKRGAKLFISICLNGLILISMFYLIALGFNPIVVAILGSILITYIVLYFVNNKNIKTKSSFISIGIILVVLSLFLFIVVKKTLIAGFGSESYEEINMFSYDVNLDFTNVTIAIILIGLIGAIIDSSVAISSALYEVYLNNSKLSKKELFSSGLTIGKDILGTTTNTLLFAFLGEFMTLLIWFKSCKYSFGDIINNKTFNIEFIKIIFSALGCVFIIPLSACILTYEIKRKDLKNEKRISKINRDI